MHAGHAGLGRAFQPAQSRVGRQEGASPTLHPEEVTSVKFIALPFLVLLGAGLLLPGQSPAGEPASGSLLLPVELPAGELAPGYGACMRRARAVDEEIGCLAMAEAWWDRQVAAALARAKASCEKSLAPAECHASLKASQQRWTVYRDAASQAFQDRYAGASQSTVEALRSQIAMSRNRAALLGTFAGE